MNLTADDLELELERFGASWTPGGLRETQALFDSSRSTGRGTARWNVADPVPVGICPCESAMGCASQRGAGISVPDDVLGALEDAGPDARASASSSHATLVEGRSRPTASTVIPPFKQPAAALDLLA